MKCKYSISFEFETSQPITEKGEITASSIRTVAARALDDATNKNPNVNWSSIVLMIERVPKDKAAKEEEKETIKEKEE